MKETTQILHKGDSRERYQGAINPPVFQASLFGYKTYQEFLDAYADPDQRQNQPAKVVTRPVPWPW